MIELTSEQTQTLERIVLKFLRGARLNAIKIDLENECGESNIACETLYKSVLLTPPKTPLCEPNSAKDPLDNINAILARLNIKKKTTEEDGPYEKLIAKSKNLHDLLKNLYHDGHDRVKPLLDLIENTTPRTDWTLVFLLGAIASAGLGAFAHLNRRYLVIIGQWFSHTFPQVVTWLGRTLSILRNIPIIGIIFNSLILTWSWYTTFTNGTTTTPKMLEDLFFKTLISGLTISAYALAFFAGGVITGPAALLFILSSATKVIKGAYEWWKNSEPEELRGEES